jgi:alpha-mannosidase
MLDSLLIVRGEEARTFRLGVGIDLTHPANEALSLITPATAEFKTAAPPSGPSSSWLFHVDSKNVVATHWAPIVEEKSVVGFRARIQEVYGRAAKVTLSTFRNVASAVKVDFSGDSIGGCHVEADKISFDISPREWTELEVRF